MASTLFAICAAIFMVVAIGVFFAWFLRSVAVASSGRMRGMMMRAGLASLGDPQDGAVMEVARRRCGNCQHKGYCDKWLAGEAEGDNAFCPNAGTFRALLSRMKAAYAENF